MVAPSVIRAATEVEGEVADRAAAYPRVAWEVHDRTHLEANVVYPLAEGVEHHRCGWEAFFVAPESFQLSTVPNLPGQFLTRVRRAVPSERFDTLSGAPLAELEQVLTEGVGVERRLRLFACLVKRTVVSTIARLDSQLDDPAGVAAARRELECAQRLAREVHLLLASDDDDELAVARHGADEYISLSIEGFFEAVALALKDRASPEPLAEEAVASAVAEARYRRERGYESVLVSSAPAREVERYDLWRHALKRQVSSVLWLTMSDRQPRRWARHVLYGMAAALAMAFAVAAAIWNGTNPADRLASWLLVAVLAYAGKDRLKASLQGYLGDKLLRRLPNHRWTLRDPDSGDALGAVDEHTRLVDWDEVPDTVERCQPDGWGDDLTLALPQYALRHAKTMTLDGRTVHRDDEPYRGVVEVCRVDLSRWLAHTDDPKRDVQFADPDAGEIVVQKAARVYDVLLCCRAWAEGAPDSPWQCLRVVVSRKGILRIDRLDGDRGCAC